MVGSRIIQFERRLRRRLGLPAKEKGTILPWALSEARVAELRSARPGPIETAFFEHRGREAHKWTHYLPIYDRVFGPWVGKPVKMLEIGVNEGGSLELWRTIFGPDATIMGIDINPFVAGRVDLPNRVMIGSQDDPDFLHHVVAEMGPPDIVLDDGSHIGRHIIRSFETLFPLMAVGGIYVIEDLQPSYWPGEHEGGYRRKGTAIEYLKDLIDEINGDFHGRTTSDTFRQEIGSIQIFKAMAVIEKCSPAVGTGHVKRGKRTTEN